MKTPQTIYQRIIKRFAGKRVLLTGDPILDIYVYGKALGISAETPTVVAEEKNTEISFGGASLVARNLLELGARVTYFAVLGNDDEGKLYARLSHKNLKTHFIIDKTRQTTTKKRFWIDSYKLLQLDRLDNRDISRKLADKIATEIKLEIADHDVMIISDNQHGMMTDGLIKALRDLSPKYHVNTFVDSQASQKESNIEKYQDFDYICLNLEEARLIDSRFTEKGSFANLKKKLGKANICVKLGEKGSLASIDKNIIRTPAIKVNAVDTCGAGDAFLSAFSLGAPKYPAESLFIANAWAGLATTKHGINPPARQELIDFIANLSR